MSTAIKLTEGQRELIVEEAGRFAAQVQNPAAREAYRRLREEAENGAVPEELLEALGSLLRIGLGSGRIRALHGAHAEMEATSLFQKTPQGKELNAQFDAANEMFKALEGQELRKITLSARGPGMYTLTVETSEAKITTALTEAGVDVRSVEVAL